ncbi:unnamed protein product [Closterium sp. NIES-65]|nr:unnamed protein product [Closterium sp. NIES-65]
MVVCLACADINQAAPSPSAILSHTPLTSLRFEEPQVFSELQSEIALDLFIPDGNWQIKLDAPGGGVRGIVQVVGALSGNATLQRTNGRGGRTSARGSATGWGTAWSVSGNGGESGGVVDTTLAQLTDLGASKDVVVTWGGCATSKTTVANGRSAVLAKRLYGCRETCAAMATCVLGACENVGVEEASGVFVDCAVVCNMAPFTITQYSNWTCVQVTSHQRRLLQLVRGQPPQIPSLQRQAQGHVQTPMSLSTTSPLEATLVRGLASQTPPLQGRAQGHVQRQMSLSQTVPLEVPRAEGKPQGNVQVKIEERAHVESQVRAQGKIRSAARKRTAGRMLGVFGGSNGDVSLPRHHHPLWHVRRDAPMEGTREGVEEGEKDVVVLKAQGGTAAENGEGGAAAEAADEVGLAARVGEEEAEEEEQEGEAGEAEEGADSGFSVWTDSSSSAGSIGHVESVETVPASNPSLHPFSPPPPLFLPLRFLSPNPSNTPAVPAPSPIAPTATAAAAAAAAAAASAAAAAAAADTTTPTSTSDNTAQLVAQAITDTQAISQGGAQTVTGAQAVSQANTQAITGAQAITDAWAALGPTERQRWFNLRVAVSRALFSWVGDACLANVFSAVSLDAATRARVSALFCALLHSPGEAQGGQGVAAGASGASDGSLLGSSLFSSSDVIGGGSFDVAAVGGNGCVLGPFTSVDGSMAAAAAHFAFHGFPPAPPPAFNTTNTNGTASNGAASNGTASNETASSVSAPDLLSRRLRMSRDQFARFIGTFLDAVESVVVLDGATSIVVVDGAALSRLSSHLSVSTAFETSQNGAALSRLSSHLSVSTAFETSQDGAALSRLSSHLSVSTEGCSPRESVSRLPFLHFTCRLFCDGGDNDGRLLEWAVGADFNVTVGRGDSVQFVWADDYPHSVKVRGLGSSAHDSLFKGYGANRMVLSRHSRCAPDNVGTMPLDGPPHPCALCDQPHGALKAQPLRSRQHGQWAPYLLTACHTRVLSVNGPSDAPAFTYTAVFTQTGSYKVECGRFGADMTATIHVVDDSEDDSSEYAAVAFLLDPFFDANTTTNPGTPLLSPLTSSCYPGCSFGNLADGRCDPLCNNHHCAFDGGDCECATLAGSGGGVGGECPCPAGQTRSEAGSCCPTDAVGTNLLFPFQLRSFGPDAHASNTQFSELYEKPLHRHVTERNRPAGAPASFPNPTHSHSPVLTPSFPMQVASGPLCATDPLGLPRVPIQEVCKHLTTQFDLSHVASLTSFRIRFANIWLNCLTNATSLISFGINPRFLSTSDLYDPIVSSCVTQYHTAPLCAHMLTILLSPLLCPPHSLPRFASIWPHCLTNATSLTSFGINPRFLSTSDLYDPIVTAANQTGLENSTLSSAPLFNDEGLPYGFVPPMDGLESYPLIFDINLHRVAATKRLQYLVDGFYFDNLTKSIEFALITYNADVNMFVLSKIHIEVDVGGKLGYSYRLVPIPVEPYSSASSYAQMVLEIIYVVCVAYNLLEEVNEMFQTYRHSGSFLHHFRQFGNWIDLLSLSIQVWGIVVWIIMVQQLSPLSDISVRYNVYTSLDDTTSQFWAVNTTNGGFERAMQVYRTMDDSIQLRSFYFAIQGINVFLMVQRLLKLMDFQPRIGIITRTMAAALPAILHFFLVFGIIFLGFSFYGYLVFGRTLAQFRTIPNAMLSCFFMLIQDNSTAYYYAMLEGWERLAAFVFWLSFIVIMVFILMNVVIAIVVDAFMDVKEAAQEETALPIDIWILLRNLWQRICMPYWSLRKLRHHLLFLGTHEKTREEEEALATQRKSALAEVAGMVRKGCFMSKQERETLRRIHQTKRVVDVGIDKMDIMSLYALMNRTYERKNARSVDPVTIAESVMGQFGEDVEVALLGEKPKKGKSGEMSHIKRSLQRLEGDALHPGTNSIPINLFPLSSSPPSPLLPLSSPLPFFPSPPTDGPYESHQGKPVPSSQPPTKAASKAHQVDPVTIAESVMGQFGEDVEVALLGEKPKKGKSGEMSHIKRSLQRLEENADETAYVLLQVQESLEKMRQEQEEMQQQQQLMLLRGSGKERRPELGLARGDRQWSRVRRRFEDDDDGDDDDADVSAAAALRGHGAASGRMGGEFGNPGSSGNPGRQRRARTAHMKSFGGDEPSILDAVAKLGGGLGRMGGEDVGNTSGRHRPASFSSMPRGAAEDMGMRRKMVDFPSMGGGIGGGWGMGGEDVGNISGRRKALEYGSMRRGMPGGGMAGAGMASPYRGGGFLGSGTAGFAQPRSIMPDGGFGNRKFGEGMGAGSRRMVGGEKQGSRASALLAELQAARAAGGAGSWTRIHEGEVKRVQVEYAMEAISHAGSAIGILATDGVVLAAEKRITSKLLHTPSHPFPPLPTHQVEYAMEAISHAGSAIGILATDGVVLAAEKRITSKLLESSKTNEKMYRIDDHVAAAVAGITADANILVNSARLAAQRYTYAYQEPIPMEQLVQSLCDTKHGYVSLLFHSPLLPIWLPSSSCEQEPIPMEQLVQSLCDTKQGYTQFGGLRPFGVSFLFAGWDKHHQFQLYHSDPSGNYGGWRACAIGANHGAAQSLLKQEYKEEKGPGGEAIPGMDLEGAVQLALKVLSKTMDSTSLSAEKIELAKVCLEDGQVRYRVFGAKEIDELLLKYEMAQPKEER